jgi:threonylcarbamoyladenosine tRNA methylthiotransferase MtaB
LETQENFVKLRVALKTMGCRVNAYDSALLLGAARALPLELVEFDAEADVYVINSCTVTANADAEVRHLAKRAKRRAQNARVLVTGCMATRAADELLELPEVDAVFPNLEKPAVPHFLAQVAAERLGLETSPNPDDDAIPDTADRARPLVKVQEGCEQFCSFCIIPTTRGKERSRPLAEVLREVSRLLERGAREIVLTGVHLGSYGRDLDQQQTLPVLVRALDRLGVPRVRLSSLEPWGLTPELLDALAETRSFCPQLHLPLQSGDADVLRAMNRPYTPQDYAARVLSAVERFPGLCVGTDVIVGFPGESPDAFENTFALLRDLPVSYFHVFPYSARPGTPAVQHGAQVPSEESKRRGARLRQLGSEKKDAFVRSWLGREVEVLVESKRDRATGRLKGISREYVPVVFDGPDHLRREIARVRVLAVEKQQVQGELGAPFSGEPPMPFPSVRAFVV